MASSNPNARRVTITRDQRDVLHREIRDHAIHASIDDLPNSLSWPGSGDYARELVERVRVIGRVLEEIGWDRYSRLDVYTLTLDAELVDWFADRLRQTEAYIAGEALALTEVKDGKDPWAVPGRGRIEGQGTLEEDVAELRATLDSELELAGACRAILAQVS